MWAEWFAAVMQLNHELAVAAKAFEVRIDFEGIVIDSLLVTRSKRPVDNATRNRSFVRRWPRLLAYRLCRFVKYE